MCTSLSPSEEILPILCIKWDNTVHTFGKYEGTDGVFYANAP